MFPPKKSEPKTNEIFLARMPEMETFPYPGTLFKILQHYLRRRNKNRPARTAFQL